MSGCGDSRSATWISLFRGQMSAVRVLRATARQVLDGTTCRDGLGYGGTGLLVDSDQSDHRCREYDFTGLD